MTKAKRIEKKATKVAQVEEVKANLSAEELVAKAAAEFAKKFPDPTVVLAKLPSKKLVVEPKEVVEEIIDDLGRSDEDDDLEIIEVAPVKGKKVISQNSAQAQKLLKQLNPAFVKAAPVVAKKKLADMTKKELAEYYANLSAKATAAKHAKAEALLAAEGKTGFTEKVPEIKAKTLPFKSKRTSAPAPEVDPLKGKVIPEEMTGRQLKTLLKAEKKAAKKGSKPTKEATSKRTGTPLSKMTIEELNGIKGTIADVQWNKYFKMAGGVSGIVIKKADKPVVEKKAEVAPVVVKKVVRTAAPEVKAEVKEVKVAPKAKTITLADFTLDELITELRARGCKGSISVCTEVEL